MNVLTLIPIYSYIHVRSYGLLSILIEGMGLFMIAANKIKEEREAARQQQIVEAAEQTK